MQPGEISSVHFLLPPYPSDFINITQNNTPTVQFNFLPNNPIYNFPYPFQQVPDLTNQNSSLSSNYTSDEADEQQTSLINERKQRRMISNRESARRSRMRKQRHLDELWSQVAWLRNENNQIMDKLNLASERHDQALQENALLKEEASELRQLVSDHLQLNSPFSALKDLDGHHHDHVFSNLKSESVNVTSSKGLLG